MPSSVSRRSSQIQEIFRRTSRRVSPPPPHKPSLSRQPRANQERSATFRHLHPHDAEYSWVGRTGDGYRYDHAFCSRPFRDLITDCRYVHQPGQDKLSDHSALTMRLSLAPPQELPVSDPAAEAEPPTLF
jgi:hypothetical protein